MGFFDSLFGGGGGGEEDAASVANSYFEQIPGAVKPYYDPFIKSGREAEAITNPIYGRMAQDPNEFLNALMRNYSPSEGYKFKEKYLSDKLRNTAAEGGYAGTPHSEFERGGLISGLLGEDMQQFLQNILGIQGTGLAGQEARTTRGFDASRGLADILGSNLATQGGLSFQGAQQRNKNALDKQEMAFNFLNGLIGSGAKAYSAGMFGGPGAGGAGKAGGFF